MGLAMRSHFLIALFALACLSAGSALAQDETALIQKRDEIREMASDALANLYEISPGTRYAIEHAAGYAVFSTFGVKIFFAGGTTGKGVVVNNRTRRETFMKMVGAQAGLGFGVQKDRLIFVFESQSALRGFIDQGWDFSTQANLAVMVADQGGAFAGAVAIAPGVYAYQLTETGLAAQIALTGRKFFKDDELN